MASDTASNWEAALSRFGLSQFRPGQREVISALLDGSDCLCIMPTGGGKSLCYQLPATIRPGVAVVISPLIALMKDQVDSLLRIGVRATCINSSIEPAEQGERLRGLAAGEYDLVYAAPERFRDGRFAEALLAAKVQLLAVDEAHCISEWGHDFRPDYARIGHFRERLGQPQTIALTATATPRVRADVIEQLRLKQPQVFVTGFARPNLSFCVSSPRGQAEKDEALLRFLSAHPGSGIVYAATRKRCEELAVLMRDAPGGRTVGVYHAGLMPEERRAVQDQFMSGKTSLITATNAFGMGIDKADLRFVVHYNLPGSLEAYYQEAGRAGRDGQPAVCHLLYSPSDRYLQEFFIENAFPTRELLETVYEFLRQQGEGFLELTQHEIKEMLGLRQGGEAVGACEQVLQRYGGIERLDTRQNQASVRIESKAPTLVELLPREAKVQRRVMSAIERMVAAGGGRGERVPFLLKDLAAEAELDREALQRALRELSGLPGFDYQPPFRGRAVRVVDRSRPFEDIPIDFDRLEERRASEYEKLDQMVGYAQTRSCRQLEILHYFGDPTAAVCGVCDHCQTANKLSSSTRPAAGGPGRSEAAAGPHAEAILAAVRMALSGVARLKQRFGRQVAAMMLVGSKATKLKKLGLSSLSTFGLLAVLRQEEAVELLSELQEAGLIEQFEETPRRPLIRLSDLGREVMLGKAGLPVNLTLPAPLLLKLQAIPPGGHQDRGPAPPQPTPDSPAAEIPAKPAIAPSLDGGSSSGASPAPMSRGKADEPGEAVSTKDERTSAVRIEPPQPLVEAPKGEALHREPTARAGDHRAAHYWTWRLLESGYLPEECAAIRNFSREEILQHAVLAAEDGYWFDPALFLSVAQQQLIERLLHQARRTPLPDLLARLPPSLSPLLVRLQLALGGASAAVEERTAGERRDASLG